MHFQRPRRIAAGLSLVLLFAAASTASADRRRAPKLDVNYAFGGATTGEVNATGQFLPDLAAAVQAIGLELFGLDFELELAIQTLDRVNSQADIFWVWAGLNDYLAGSQDPTVAPARLIGVLEALYERSGARIFVVPNLFRAGMIPLAQTLPPGAAEGLDALSGAHNAILAGSLQAFAAAHPDATVIPVDVFSIFEGFAGNPEFTNLTDSCVDVGLPAGDDCDGWLFFDTVHPTSAAMGYVATAAADATTAALDGAPVRRVITIGDSFSDTGMFFDTVERTTGAGFPASPPFFDGRFADGPNALDQFETLVGARYLTSRFAQPFREALVAEVIPGYRLAFGEIELDGEVFVRRSITGNASFAALYLGAARCLYRQGANERLELRSCTRGVRAGDRIETDLATLVVWGTDEDVATELFYY